MVSLREVQSRHHVGICMKLEVGWAVAVMFMVFLMGMIWLVALEARQPYLMSVVHWPSFFPSKNPTANDDDAAGIRATNIRGIDAVAGFRNHLRCFSESGKWVYDPKPRHLPWNYVGDTYASTCDGQHQRSGPGHVFGDEADDIAMRGGAGDWLVREELKWVWQTNSSCPWRHINRDDFCERIGSKQQLMVVGDSLNHEISWSLMNAIITNGSGYGHLSSNDRSIHGPYEMCGDIFGAGRGFTVSFVRNDRLSPRDNVSVDTWHNFYEFPWLNLLDEYEIKLLLLNRGAHYEDDDIYGAALREIFSILSTRYPYVRVIYRNTQPGHRNCMNFTRPLSQAQQDLPANWHWGDFYRQNLLAKDIVEEFDYIYMDVHTMLSLRPEGHVSSRDCLHYCVPGPLDLVVEYLYNILLLV